MRALRLWLWQGLLLSALLQQCPALDGDCVTLSASHSVVTQADLKDSYSKVLHRCYHVPRPSMMLVVLQCLSLHNQVAMRLYTDGSAVEITKDCCISQKDPSESDTMETATECGVVHKATDIVEIYLRDDRSQESCDYEDKNCPEEFEFEIHFSVVKRTSCRDAIFPLDFDACYLNTSLSAVREECLRVTCTDSNVITPDETVEYTVPVGPNTCIWQLDTSQQKHLKLAFSPNIQKYITVFEGSLFNPKWSLAGCASMKLLNLNVESDVVYIVYHNGQPEDAEGSLVISHQSDPCLLPPVIDHGNVEFERFGANAVAHYTCNQGYELQGEAVLICREGQWAQAPTCVTLTKEKQVMTDAPMDEKSTGVEDNDTMTAINSPLVPSLVPPEEGVADTYDSRPIITGEEESGSEGDSDYTTQDFGDSVYKDSEFSSGYDDYDTCRCPGRRKMRLGDGAGTTAAAALAVLLLGMVDITRAKPNFFSEGQRPEEQIVEISQTVSTLEEQECPHSILYTWLEAQEPWHIMGELGDQEEEEVQDEDSPFPEIQLQSLDYDDMEAQHQEEQEEDEEVEEEAPEEDEGVVTSPVSLEILGEADDGLLNPGKDYEVFVLSDTVNTARILLVLDSYLELSTCGVGGFIQVEEEKEDPGYNYALPPDALRVGLSGDYAEDPNYVPPEGGMNSTISVGKCFWWAEGVLVSGDEVSVEYTPPECGCVVLSVYAAFDIENITMISGPNPKMGPQSKLLCVDRTATEPKEVQHFVQLQDALPVPQDETDVDDQSNDLVDDDEEDEDEDDVEDEVVTPQPVEPKEKRRRWRQRIRKNKRKRSRCNKRNWWKCRKNKVAKMKKGRSAALQDERENEDGGGEDMDESKGHRKNHGKAWRRKKQHKRRNGWRKSHRQFKKARKANSNKCTRWKRRRGLCNVIVPEVPNDDLDASNETEPSQDPVAVLRNQIDEEDEDLFNLLLGTDGDYETTLEQEEQEEQDEQEELQVVSESPEGEEGRREGRKHNPKPLINQRKMRRMLPPGKKFCCKQGIAMRKTSASTVATTTSPIEDILLMTTAYKGQQEAQEALEEQEEEVEEEEEEEEEVCREVPQEVTAWAHYKLKIDPSECEMVHKTCCSKFSVEWLAARQRRQERKEKRKNNQLKRGKKKEKRQKKKTERKAKIEAKKNKWEARKAKWLAKGKIEEDQVEE